MRLDPEDDAMQDITGPLQVAYGMPPGLPETAWSMLEAITGMSFESWKADCPENALVVLSSLHVFLGKFKLYFELDKDKCFIVRGRMSPYKANPITSLRGLASAYYLTSTCNKEGVLLNQPLYLPPPLRSDQPHMASVDPDVLEPDDDEEEEEEVLNKKNIYRVLDKLDW
ncbi:hypothetical protein BT96DRAFT_1001289 [Gymnopus androsaceus JB14]|uniref:Uncharacterized protein n=1 Tax=Gymnopus androsaceus JB14 TaxID=1447944 RepID=A0A6A4H169_9AGAR|nr:hypothetical protein BT96DRAFT_1001289 [Gymnopus androsaceus JB14]